MWPSWFVCMYVCIYVYPDTSMYFVEILENVYTSMYFVGILENV